MSKSDHDDDAPAWVAPARPGRLDAAFYLNETIAAYEALGATDHTRIIRELVPMAERRWVAIRDASAAGREFNYDDSPFKAYEPQWDSACEQFDFYGVLFADMRKHPKKYQQP